MCRHLYRGYACGLTFHSAYLLFSLASGKSVYFWALVSALGTFWLGAGVSMRHSIEELITPTVALDKVCCLLRVVWQATPPDGVSPKRGAGEAITGDVATLPLLPGNLQPGHC